MIPSSVPPDPSQLLQAADNDSLIPPSQSTSFQEQLYPTEEGRAEQSSLERSSEPLMEMSSSLAWQQDSTPKTATLTPDNINTADDATLGL